jgi:hypothetical protein
LFSWVVVTTILAALLIYGKIVSEEENSFHTRRLEDERVVDEERAITDKLDRLKRSAIPLAVLSGALLLATATVWIWLGLRT